MYNKTSSVIWLSLLPDTSTIWASDVSLVIYPKSKIRCQKELKVKLYSVIFMNSILLLRFYHLPFHLISFNYEFKGWIIKITKHHSFSQPYHCAHSSRLIPHPNHYIMNFITQCSQNNTECSTFIPGKNVSCCSISMTIKYVCVWSFSIIIITNASLRFLQWKRHQVSTKLYFVLIMSALCIICGREELHYTLCSANPGVKIGMPCAMCESRQSVHWPVQINIETLRHIVTKTK